ncbi:MAG: hypothetical protein LBS60_08905 [Deltaproteobacteria bacterium]|jgi:hypothetical protein|nr:hypothetical protein [Deltaproteobacteria bacterium]
MVEYKIMEPTESIEENIKILADLFVPIYHQFWEKRGKIFYGLEHWNINPVPLVQLWVDRNLLLLLAFEGEKVVGFVIGGRMTPFYQIESNCYIEAYYGLTEAIEQGLLNFLRDGFKFTTEKFLLIPKYGDKSPEFSVSLTLMNERTSYVYKR